MNVVIENLLDEHQRQRRFLTAYEREIDRLRSGGELDYDLLQDLAEYFALFPDELHHRKEDVIYDFLMESDDARAESPSQGNLRLRDLKADHAALSRDAAVFREGIAQTLAGAQLPRDELSHYAANYILTMRRHMQHEEEAFFPRALAVIGEAGWGTIERRLEGLLADDIHANKAREALEIEASLLQRLSERNAD